MKWHILPFMLAVLVSASLASVARATDRTVPDPYDEIQAAIDAATSGTDQVVITAKKPLTGRYAAFTLDKDVPVLKWAGATDEIKVAPGCAITYAGGEVSGITFQARETFSYFIDVGRGLLSNCKLEDSTYSFTGAAALVDTGGVIQNCTFDLLSGYGRAIDVQTSLSPSGKPTIQDNEINVTLTSGGSRKEGVYLEAGATIITGNTIIFTGADKANGVGISAIDGGGSSLIQDNHLIGGGTGIYVSTPSSGVTVEGNTVEDFTSGIKIGFGTGMVVNENTIVRNSCSGSAHGIRLESYFGSGYSEFTNNLIYNVGIGLYFGGSVSGNWVISHNIYAGDGGSCSTKDNRSLSQTAISDTVDVIFCAEHEEPVHMWSQRIDSEAAAGNNPWGERVGAWAVECAWGTLTRDTRLLDGESAYVLEDVIVPSGKTLTLGRSSRLKFDDNDESNGGLVGFTTLNQLTVSGNLDVNGESGHPVQFISSAAGAQEGDWLGVYILDGTTDVDYANFQHAEYGVIFGVGGSVSLDHCTFSDNATDDLHVGGTGSTAGTLMNSVITVGSGNGLYLDNTSITVTGNTFTGDNSTVSAIDIINGGDDEPTQTFDSNTIQGTDSGVGVKVRSKAPVFVKNTVRDFQWGFHLAGGGPVIGDASDNSSDNTITSNTRGIYFNCGGHTCAVACGDTAYVRNSSMTSNNTGVYVDKRGFIDLGTAASPGNNTFTSNGLHCIYNKSDCDTVKAVGNWYGSYPPYACWSGLVDPSSPLSSAPASRPGIEVVAMDPATGLRILAAIPNPAPGTTTLRLETAGGHATIGVEVYDVAGRLVRRLDHEARLAGIHEVSWDGRDGAGRPVPNGLYFIRASAGFGLEARTKVLVTR